MRRFHLVATFAFAFVVALYYLAPSSSSRASLSFFSTSTTSDPCPNPFNPQPVREPLRDPVCRMLDTHLSLDTEHSLGVELCMSSIVPNHGTIRIERSDRESCAASEDITTSSNSESDATLRAKGPDVFHIRFDGEQRLALEEEVEYEGSCVYTHYFRLNNAAPFNLSIWWALENYRAAYELKELATQYDMAMPVLADTHLIVNSPASTGAEFCPSVSAVATLPQWRSPAVAEFMETLPQCSAYTPTDGVYLHPHHSEDPAQFYNQYLFQPTGCQWSNPIRFGAPAVETTRDFQRRNILVLGDSHVRFAYDLLLDTYKGDWKAYLAAESLKGWNKGETFGETRLDFYWEPVLQENRIEINCTVAQQYDTIVLGAGQHNGILIPKEREHKHQYTLRAWNQLVRNLAQRLGPDACPGQQMPKIVWLGTPARPTRIEPAKSSDWLDARSSRRMRLYDEIAWSHFKMLPGAARVDMFALSQPFVNDFGDKLHMRHSDSLAALVQELHEKIRPTEKAYMHLDAASRQ